jgi:hypothetical protein
MVVTALDAYGQCSRTVVEEPSVCCVDGVCKWPLKDVRRCDTVDRITNAMNEWLPSFDLMYEGEATAYHDEGKI